MKKISNYTAHVVTILFGVAGLVACASVGSLAKALDFESIAGAGQLRYKEESKPEIFLSNAEVVVESNLSVGDHSNCRGLTLKSNQDIHLLLVSCPFEVYFICPGGIDSCTPEKLSRHIKTQANGNVFQMRSFIDSDMNFRVELYPGKLIYRIQESKCMIKYPHGCLINWFGWNDIDIYNFETTAKQSGINEGV